MSLRFLAFAFLNLYSCLIMAADEQFLIGVGDRIIVTVYNEPDLTVRARIGKSGVVNFPLLGNFTVSNKTPKQLSTELEEKLLDGYIVNPLVSVLIEQYRPFYMRGEVRSPGVYPFSLELTVDQAVAIAGGLKDRASRSSWYIVRGEDKTKLKVDKDTKVLPGDVITIKASLF
ncbi:MAG: polysaccharide export protein [Paraglaciecola sp.]|nr:polysaccharide export protein [Paraglaciecola sp.]